MRRPAIEDEAPFDSVDFRKNIDSVWRYFDRERFRRRENPLSALLGWPQIVVGDRWVRGSFLSVSKLRVANVPSANASFSRSDFRVIVDLDGFFTSGWIDHSAKIGARCRIDVKIDFCSVGHRFT